MECYWLSIEGVPCNDSLNSTVNTDLPQQTQSGQLPQRYLNYFVNVTKTLLGTVT